MQKIRRDDMVVVIAGKDKGKTGKIIRLFPPAPGTPRQGRALIQGINFVKRHVRPRRQGEPGGIVEQEGPVAISNLALYCTRCKRSARVEIRVQDRGGKVRFCRRCQEEL